MTTSTTGPASRLWETSARTGFAVSGLLHLALGWLIVRIGLGSGDEADQTAALARISEAPLGTFLLWFSVAALAALATWQLAQTLSGGARDRAKAAGKGVLYLALGATAASVALGSSGGGDSASGLAGTLMEAPAGRLLVGAVGLGVLAGAVYHVHKGWTQGFVDDLANLPTGPAGRTVRVAGSVGYVAKGVALGAVGALFVIAAWRADPARAQGTDGAIDWLLGLPAGAAVVTGVGVGFALYGLYSFARARYARM